MNPMVESIKNHQKTQTTVSYRRYLFLHKMVSSHLSKKALFFHKTWNHQTTIFQKTRVQIASLENFSPWAAPSSGRRLLPLHRHLGEQLRLSGKKISRLDAKTSNWVCPACPFFFKITGKYSLLVRRQPTKMNCLQTPSRVYDVCSGNPSSSSISCKVISSAAGAATVASSSRFGSSRKLRHESRQLVQQCTALDPDAC